MTSDEKETQLVRQVVKALFAKRKVARDSDDMYDSPALTNAWRKIMDYYQDKFAASDVLGIDLAVGDALGDLPQEIWDNPLMNEEETVKSVTKQMVTNTWILPYLKWIAIVPIEQSFLGLPPETDLILFKLLNPLARGTNAVDWSQRVADHILKTQDPRDKWEIEFPCVDTNGLKSLLDHQIRKSTGEKRSPVIVLSLKRGQERANEWYARDRIVESLNLIQFLHLVSRRAARVGLRAHAPGFRWPGDKFARLYGGIIVEANLCRQINWLPVGHANFDSNEPPIDGDTFLEAWNSHGRPFAELCQSNFGGPLLDRLKSAVSIMSRCRYEAFSDIALSATIAMEAILNPSNEKDNLTERFAIFGASMMSSDFANRKAIYNNLRMLYNYRSSLVHTGIPKTFEVDFTNVRAKDRDSYSRPEEERNSMAFSYFLKVFDSVADWLRDLQLRNPKASRKEIESRFKEYYLNSVLGGIE